MLRPSRRIQSSRQQTSALHRAPQNVAAGRHTLEIVPHVEAAIPGGAVAQGLARRLATARTLSSRTRMTVLRLVLNSRARADTVAPPDCAGRSKIRPRDRRLRALAPKPPGAA